MPKDRNGILGTIIFHGLILILLLIFGFSTHLPLPGEQGILVNFGDSQSGIGDIEPAVAESRKTENINEQPQLPQEAVKSEVLENIMTQDFEDAPTVQVKKKNVKRKQEETVKEVTKPVETPKTEEKKVEEKPKVNARALYTGKNTGTTQTGSQGIGQNGGNQGSPDGSTESDNYLGQGLGTEGVSVNLEGRGGISLPLPSKNYQKQGVIVVEILVDRSGNVVSAREGVRGSTTTDVTLLKLAREAALRSRFTSKDDAPVHQKGTITYTFKLN